MSSSSPAPSNLSIQGRWAWRALPFVAAASLAFLWENARTVRESEEAARRHLLHNASGWSLIYTLTGRTVGR